MSGRFRPRWAVLGLAGACAVCCAVPAAVLLIGGATLGGLGLALGRNWDAVVCGGLVVILLGAAAALYRPRRAEPACRIDGSCGCKESPEAPGK